MPAASSLFLHHRLYISRPSGDVFDVSSACARHRGVGLEVAVLAVTPAVRRIGITTLAVAIGEALTTDLHGDGGWVRARVAGEVAGRTKLEGEGLAVSGRELVRRGWKWEISVSVDIHRDLGAFGVQKDRQLLEVPAEHEEVLAVQLIVDIRLVAANGGTVAHEVVKGVLVDHDERRAGGGKSACTSAPLVEVIHKEGEWLGGALTDA